MKIISNKYTENTFENIKHIDEYGNEFWFARELQKVLEYKDWRNFQKVIDKAILSANNSVSSEEDWVVEVNKPIKTGKGKEEIIKDYKLSRYICYLIVQNANPSKEVVALGQTYFAIQTRKQEITEQEYDSLSDDEKAEFDAEYYYKICFWLDVKIFWGTLYKVLKHDDIDCINKETKKEGREKVKVG